MQEKKNLNLRVFFKLIFKIGVAKVYFYAHYVWERIELLVIVVRNVEHAQGVCPNKTIFKTARDSFFLYTKFNCFIIS